MDFLAGKKTYIIAAIAVLVGLDQGLIQAGVHIPPIPTWVMTLLGAAGLYTLRNGITTDTAKAVSTIVKIAASPVVVVQSVPQPSDDLTHAIVPAHEPIISEPIQPLEPRT